MSTENNAPSPEVMREDFVNLFVARGGVSRNKSEQLVDEMLKRQMGYYAMMAEPEVTDNPQEIILALTGLEETVNLVISTGASVVEFMPPDVRARWQTNTAKLRQKAAQVLALLC
jgi:hypothetical protein